MREKKVNFKSGVGSGSRCENWKVTVFKLKVTSLLCMFNSCFTIDYRWKQNKFYLNCRYVYLEVFFLNDKAGPLNTSLEHKIKEATSIQQATSCAYKRTLLLFSHPLLHIIRGKLLILFNTRTVKKMKKNKYTILQQGTDTLRIRIAHWFDSLFNHLED